MEAATLPKKKINKTKLKKTIKNVLCRPDPVFWPQLSSEEKESIESILHKYKVNIPEYKKPLWKELKDIPKEQRPKQPKLERPEGLIFGLTECLASVKNGNASTILIESGVNPRTIVQPILEASISKKILVACLEGLRKLCASNFGIPTTCLGVKQGSMTELTEKVKVFVKMPEITSNETENIVKEKPSCEAENVVDLQESIPSLYLYRTSKKTRVFVPPSENSVKKHKPKFEGQDFIKLPSKPKEHSKNSYKKMVVKRISNNPNRVKVKNK